ncbi:hypothetical protein EJB05_57452, partial [Eragrostis curvula]
MHIDRSLWESRRALQRVVAEQLGLPAEAMDMFDKEDEEDDFRGLPPGVATSHQGDVSTHTEAEPKILGDLPQWQQRRDRSGQLLWLSSVRIFNQQGVVDIPREVPVQAPVNVDRAMESAGTTVTFLSATCDNEKDPKKLWSYLICDGIIKQQLQLGEGDISVLDEYDDGLWRTADALQREIQLDVDFYHQYVPSSPLTRFVESKPYWTSPTYGFIQILDGVNISNGGTFQNYFCTLSVLKLLNCTFNFPSAPFRYCHNLTFLWLDRCQVVEISTTDGVGTEDADIRWCFQRLWVLDLRYMVGCDHILSAWMMDLMTHLRELKVVGVRDWDMGQLQGRLPNICKLRVQKYTAIHCSCSEDDLFSEKNKMELLDFSGNETSDSMKSLCGPRVGKSNTSLGIIIIDRCTGSLEKISFRGCTNLKNILLRGWHANLYTLDISGTAVKILDFTTIEIYYLGSTSLL